MKKKNYNKNIKLLRQKHGMNQEEAAKLIGVSINTLRNKEKGKTEFTLNEVMNLLEYWKEDINAVV